VETYEFEKDNEMTIEKTTLKIMEINKMWTIRPVQRYGGKITSLKPETGRFNSWKANFKEE
jgi:hypothetical protein